MEYTRRLEQFGWLSLSTNANHLDQAFCDQADYFILYHANGMRKTHDFWHDVDVDVDDDDEFLDTEIAAGSTWSICWIRNTKKNRIKRVRVREERNTLVTSHTENQPKMKVKMKIKHTHFALENIYIYLYGNSLFNIHVVVVYGFCRAAPSLRVSHIKNQHIRLWLMCFKYLCLVLVACLHTHIQCHCARHDNPSLQSTIHNRTYKHTHYSFWLEHFTVN